VVVCGWDSELMLEEMFCPILCVIPYDDLRAAAAQVGAHSLAARVSDWIYMDHTGCHQLYRVLTHDNNVVKSGNPPRGSAPGPSPSRCTSSRATAVGLYELNSVDPELESAWYHSTLEPIK
jgi:hypothetical protein